MRPIISSKKVAILAVFLMALAFVAITSAPAAAASDYDFYENSVVVGGAAIDYNLFFDNPDAAINIMNQEFSQGASTIDLYILGQHTEYYDVFTGESIPRQTITEQVTYLVDATGTTTPNQDQAAPSGLAGVAPTSAANNDGKITGTTADMEYKLSAASSYTAATETETTGLAAGTYLVRYAAKSGFNPGATVEVIVPAYTADAASALAAKMQEMYSYLDATDKSTVDGVRTNLNTLSDAQLDTVIAPLLTPAAIAKFDNLDDAKTQLRSFTRDFGTIYYSTDETALTTTLNNFKTDHAALFVKLFGADITADDIYNLLIEAQNQLPTVIQDSSDPITLFNKTDTDLKALWPDFAETSLQNAVAEPAFSVFHGKLGAIGWSADMFATQQQALAAMIDTNHDTELIFGKAYIRSQTNLYSGLTTLTKTGNTTYQITIMGLGASTASAKVLWASSNTGVAEFSTFYKNKLTAHNSTGTQQKVIISVYRDVNGNGVIDESNWILQFEVTVQP